MRLNESISFDSLPESDNKYDLVPPGDYEAIIKNAELKPTKAGTGEMIKLRLDITGPTHVGRVVFANLNTINPSAAAQNIGRAQLKQIMAALGLAELDDTDQLIGGHIGIKVAIREAKDGYEAQNEVKGYRTLGQSVPLVPKPSFAKPVETAAPAKGVPNWAKPKVA